MKSTNKNELYNETNRTAPAESSFICYTIFYGGTFISISLSASLPFSYSNHFFGYTIVFIIFIEFEQLIRARHQMVWLVDAIFINSVFHFIATNFHCKNSKWLNRTDNMKWLFVFHGVLCVYYWFLFRSVAYFTGWEIIHFHSGKQRCNERNWRFACCLHVTPQCHIHFTNVIENNMTMMHSPNTEKFEIEYNFNFSLSFSLLSSTSSSCCHYYCWHG